MPRARERVWSDTTCLLGIGLQFFISIRAHPDRTLTLLTQNPAQYRRVVPIRSGSSAPVFDAVVVGCEAVADPPQNRLGAAGDIDLAVDGSDVGLHRVRAEMGQGCHLGVAVALGDLRQNLGFPVGKSLASSRPVQPIDAAGPKGWIADHHLTGM